MISARELDIHDLSRPRDGEVDRWVRWAVTFGCLVTFLIAVTVPRVVAPHGEDTMFDGFWFKNGLALGTGLVIAFGWLPFGPVSRSVRLAIVLPLLHLAVMTTAWIGWTVLASRMKTAAEVMPMLEAVPLGWVFVGVAASIAIAGCWIGRRRRGETIHAIVMISLVALLLLGVWLPLASSAITTHPDGDMITWTDSLRDWDNLRAELAAPARLVAIVLVPPLLLAIAYTLVAIRRRHWIAGLRPWLITALAIAWALAIDRRHDASDHAAIVYSNFAPWLVATAVAAVGAIAALSVVTWLGARRQRAGTWQQHTGRVAGERGELIAGFEITSWLRGPRAITSACEIATVRGTLPVPAGAQLIAPLPLSSTLLRTGERVAIIRGGDEVCIGGYEQHVTGQPFRDSGAPIPSEHGLVIGPASQAGFGQLALVAWRPCVAYLLILVAVAIPALVAAIHPR